MKTNLEIIRFLKENVAVFNAFADERLAELVDRSRLAIFEANEGILHHGDKASHLGVVLGGTAVVSVVDSDGSKRIVERIEAGSTFGELALLTGEPILPDLVTESYCEVLLIPVSVFQSMIMTEPAAIQQLSRNIAGRFRALLGDPMAAAAALAQRPDPYDFVLKGERREGILVVNCGSSSLKYSFFDTEDESRHAHGLVERIGLDGTRHVYNGPQGKIRRTLATSEYTGAFRAMIDELTAGGTGVVKDAGEITLVAHRVVHGGERFTEAALITEEVLTEIEKLNPLAPLHNPVNVAGIREMQRLFPAVPHVAVFDSAFHHTMPAHAYLYGLPYELYEEKRIRRYGFHGTSHAYVSLRAAEFLKRRPNELQLVTCHLGNGSSMCAIDHGRSIDTSMGFTPVEGLIMGTRCGDIDAGVIAFLEREEGMTASQAVEVFNKKSGLLGMSGVSSDMREVLAAAEQGQRRALLALKAYCYRVRKYIGSYIAAMGGADAVIFTGGIGQGSDVVRTLALQGLERMGIRLDARRNREARGFEEITCISQEDSPVVVLVVPTDEERMMAREALRALSRSYITAALAARQQEPFPVEVSAHHVHLSQEHVEALFGPGYQLTRHAELSQPGQFACEEHVTLLGPKGRIERVRIIGPARKETQVEIAMTEQFELGVHSPLRESGDIEHTPGCTLEGPVGSVSIDKGVICVLRHIHMTPADALRYGVRDRSFVRVRVSGDRELVFGDVLVRVDPEAHLAMHIDTDEGNAAGIEGEAWGYIEGIQDNAF